MIVDERITAYINSLETPGSAVSQQIRKEALEARVPVVRSETASLLRFFVSLKQPMQILEVGTAVGYSAILMSEVMPPGARITTIEKYQPRISAAKENFIRAGKQDVITLLEGDAAWWLSQLDGPYDLIFMDAAKGQYIHFFQQVIRLLAEGGLLISDNILQDGDVMESRFVVTRRNRTIHSRMREYLYTLTHTEGLVTSLISMGDGVAVTTKRKDRNV